MQNWGAPHLKMTGDSINQNEKNLEVQNLEKKKLDAIFEAMVM
jgi:hypothetical protein